MASAALTRTAASPEIDEHEVFAVRFIVVVKPNTARIYIWRQQCLDIKRVCQMLSASIHAFDEARPWHSRVRAN